MPTLSPRSWLFTQAQASTSIGTAFIYDEDGSLLGEYDNGSAKGKGRQEYIWLPTDDGQAIPIGIYRNRSLFAVHADHLGTPRLITDDSNKPVWQWPYSAFGNNKPTGVLKATPNPKAAITNQPVLLKATNPGIEANLRFPGQYFDEESNLSYNDFRSYNAAQGRYSQPDPIGLGGGLNRFAYVGGNPLSLVDPTGLMGQGSGGNGGGSGGTCTCPASSSSSLNVVGNSIAGGGALGAGGGAVAGGIFGAAAGAAEGASLGALAGLAVADGVWSGALAGGAVGAAIGVAGGLVVGGIRYQASQPVRPSKPNNPLLNRPQPNGC